MKLVHTLFILAMFTASFEIVLTLNAGGNIHFPQLLMIFVCAAALLRVLQTGYILWTTACTGLLLWALAMIALMPVSGNPVMAIAITGLMVLTIGGYFGLLQLYGESPLFPSAMRWYLRSYVALAIAGYIQFLMPLVGLPGPFVRQWWIHGRLARINGFTYEPSFYATYMIMGWVTLLDLRLSGAAIVSGRRWMYATIALTVVLILSSSRTAIALMVLELLFRFAGRAYGSLSRSFRYLMQGRFVVPLVRRQIVLRTAITLAVMAATGAFIASRVNPLIFLNGTGIGSTAAHSVVERQDQFASTLQVIGQHPWLGRGLAGVAIAEAANHGVTVRTFEDWRLYQGFSVFATVLAASGFFAFLPFVVFVWQTSFGAVISARKALLTGTEESKWFHALARATIIVYLALCVDQNLFRIYIWIHLSMLSVAAYRMRYPLAIRSRVSSSAAQPELGPVQPAV